MERSKRFSREEKTSLLRKKNDKRRIEKRKKLHICILCGMAKTEEKMHYSKTKRGTIWFCEECYKNECRGIKEKETTETNPKKGD